jgi:hypothetical protein
VCGAGRHNPAPGPRGLREAPHPLKRTHYDERWPMKSRLRRWRYTLLLLPFVHMFAPEPVFAQPTPSDEEQFQARVEAAAVALGNNPRFKNLSLEYRRGMAEFVAGNMLFVLLHEMAHAAISEMGLPVLGREEDAADSSAVWRLVRIGLVHGRPPRSEGRGDGSLL